MLYILDICEALGIIYYLILNMSHSGVPHSHSYLHYNRNASGPSVENGLCVKNGMNSILLDRRTDFFLSTLDDQIGVHS